MIKKKRLMLAAGALLLLILLLSGCGGGGGTTGPTVAPVLTGYTYEPVLARDTVILYIDYTDPSATMNEGIAYITDPKLGYIYEELVNAPDSPSDTLLVSFRLIPRTEPGDVALNVMIENRQGTASNILPIVIKVVD